MHGTGVWSWIGLVLLMGVEGRGCLLQVREKIQLFWATGSRISLDRTGVNDWTAATHPPVRPSSIPGKPYFDPIEPSHNSVFVLLSDTSIRSRRGAYLHNERGEKKEKTWLKSNLEHSCGSGFLLIISLALSTCSCPFHDHPQTAAECNRVSSPLSYLHGYHELFSLPLFIERLPS